MLEQTEFTLSLIRHGQSTTNAIPDLMGQESTTPLSDKGIDQARLLGKHFEKHKIVFDRVYSSTYTRAHDTAKLALPNSNIILSDDIREYDAGDWTGASRIKTWTSDIKNKANTFNHTFLPPNGESLSQVKRRASKWLEDTIIYNKDFALFSSNRKVLNQSPLNIAVFSHGMTIKCLLQYIMGFERSLTWKVRIDNTSICKVSFGNDGWSVSNINDCAHLV